MKKFLSMILTCMFVCMSFCVALASDDDEVAPKKRRFLGNEKIVQLFIDSNEGYAMMEQKAFDSFAEQLQAVLPRGYRLVADNEFVAKVDLYREDKMQKLIEKSGQSEVFAAQYQAMVAQGNLVASKLVLTRDDWSEICRNSKADYVMYMRIEKGMTKMKTTGAAFIPYAGLFGAGRSTQVEMNIVTRLFNAKKRDYSYLNSQRVTGKVHGDFAVDTAAKRALPKVIPNMHLTEANF